MTKEQKDGIAKLMREHIKTQADNLILKKILSYERQTGKVVTDWRKDFALLQRQNPIYRRMIEEGEKDIAEVLAAIDRNEEISAFLKNPPKGPAN